MYIYTVQEGDKIVSIAEQFRSSVALIMAANPQLTEPPEVGRHLLVPVFGPIRVRVQPGDSLWAYSVRYDLPLEVIARANDLSPEYAIFPGQVLSIPAVLPEARGLARLAVNSHRST